MKKTKRNYETSVRRLEKLEKKLQKRALRISRLRFIFFAAAFTLPVVLIQTSVIPARTLAVGAVCLPALTGFIVLVLLFGRIERSLRKLRAQKSDQMRCLDRISPDWIDRLATDRSMPADNHPYGNDLNITGRFSLMQYLDRTVTSGGHQTLLNLLLEQPDSTSLNPEKWRERSDAVSELAELGVFRQKFRREGIESLKDDNRLDWISAVEHTSVPVFAGLEIITGLSVMLSVLTPVSYVFFSMDLLPAYFLLTLPVQFFLFLFSHFHTKKTSAFFGALADFVPAYERIFQTASDRSFSSNYLQERSYSSMRPGDRLRALSIITSLFSIRRNPFAHILAGIFLGYEFLLVYFLDRWLSINRSRLSGWFSDIFLLDALISLGEFQSDNRDFCRPEFSGELLKAQDLGHPLIHETKRIGNDIDMEERKRIWIVTGSNMSGKSTFLRTVGVNLILAMAGAPVCAKKFEFSPVRVFSSMNISDDPGRGISLFYQEVKKIKYFLEEIPLSETPFFLLVDEMLRGTNARERLIASRHILDKLSKTSCRLMVSTHDLELTNLCSEESVYYCSHFEEIIENNQMTFDYRIKQGPVKSSNAIKILELEGIIVHE